MPADVDGTILRGDRASAIIEDVKTPLVLLPMLLATSCLDAPPRFDLAIELLNPTDLVYEGSGGALGAGVEIRVKGIEDDQELIVDDACQGRHCGEYAETDPGRCGLDPKTIDPQSGITLKWDGRYFPRSVDVYGPCLAATRTVEPGDVTVTVCGRLFGGDVRNAQLRCRDYRVLVEDSAEEQVATLNVPGTPEGATLE